MASIGALVIDLVAKTGKFETDIGRAARTAEKRSKDIDRSISRLDSRIKGAFAGLAAGFSFGKIIQATSEAETALAKLDNAVRNNAGAAGASTQQLADFSSELQSLTTYGDEAIQEMQSLLLTFRQIGGPELKRAQVAVLDLATALGTDLNSAAKLIGRALADPVRGMTQLSRSGVVLDEATKKLVKSLAESGRLAEAQGILLRELENRFSGAAQAARNTFGGALTGLKNAFGDLLEAKGGLPEATAKINELSDLLADPKTKQAADTLLNGLITAAASLIPILGDVVTGLRKIFGGATDLEKLESKLQFLDDYRNSSIPVLFNFGYVEGGSFVMGPEAMADAVKRLREEIEKTKQAGQTLVRVTSPGGSRRRTFPEAAEAPPSEEFTKLEEKLQEQIALHGKVGEAAKISYAIQSGSIEGLTAAEEKQLIALARRYDALVNAADAQKKITDEQTKARESIDSMVASLQQQVSTFGQGEERTIAYRIAQGDLAATFAAVGAAADPLKEQIVELTRETERLARSADDAKQAQEAQLELEREAAAVWEATRTPLEKFNNEIKRLNELRESGAFDFDPETYSRGVKAAQDALNEATKDSEAFGEQFKDGVFRSLGDGIYTAMTDGAKKGWKGFLDAGLDTINRLVAQALAKRLAEGLFGDDKSGSSGSLGGLVSAFAGFFGGGRATGGPVHAGTMYRVNEREPEFFRPNVSGKVIPLSKMGGMGGRGGATINQYFPPETTRRTVNQAAMESSRRQRIAQSRLG